ncbi:MAG TPA: extracellular solute-binding protein [Anaerolineae bacterium]|nr:extracellular solute-binding protein [Anaerolineae bacterium]
MRKWFSTLVVLAVVLGMLVTSCKPTATPTAVPPPTVKPPTAPTATPKPADKVTITLWEQEAEDRDSGALLPLLNEFMAANPDILVEMTHYGNEELRTQFQTASLAGQAPEVVRCPNDFAGPFSTMGIVMPIKDLLDQAYLDTLLPGAVAGGVVAGTLWGVPDSSGNHLMLLYNKNLVTKVPADWDELIAMAKAQTNEAAGTWGLVYNTQEPFWLAPFLGGFGGWALDDATDMPTLNTPEMVKALQFMADLSNKHKIVPPGCDYNTADTLFKEGKAAFLINGDWSLGGYTEAGLNYGTAAMPVIKETGKYPSPMTSGKYYMVSNEVKKGTPKFEAVKKLVEFLCGEKAQQMWLEKFKVLPSNKKVAESPIIQSDPILQGSAAQLSHGRGMPAAPQLRCFWDPARPGQQGVIAGSISAAEAAVKMQEDADRCIKEAGLGPKKKIKVGLVTDVGKVNDGTFNEFAYKGMMKAVEEFGLQSAFIETLAPTDYEKNIEQFAKEGYDMIITVGFMINDATTAMAKKYPNIKFAGVDEGSDQPNFAGLVFSEDQSGFLAGCLAGLMTKSNVVGIVAGMEIPPVIKFRKGYENGVKHVNPNAKVLGVYIDSFTDPARGKEAALSQIAEKADVIFGAGGPTGSGGIMGAAAQGVWVIGVDQDEYLTTFGKGSVAGANKLLSSAMKRVDVAVYDAIKNAAMDKWQGGNVLFESKNDGVGLAPYHDTESAIPQAVKDKLTQIAADMKAGTVTSGVNAETLMAKKIKVGLVTDVGKVNDGTFNEFAYKGMMKAAEEMELTTAFIETLAPTDYEKNIEQFAKEKYDMIITVGFMINDATTAMAKKYPNIKFAGVDEGSDQPNFAGLVFSEDQSGFLAGCLAGLMTKSNVVGIVAGMEIPPVIKFRKGYENGVKHVNPNAKVLGVYIDSFTDPARGKEAALSQIAEKADVIFGAGGPTGSGGIMGAAAQGVWVIGVDQDEYLTTFGKGSVAGANKLLSSAMKRVDVAVYDAIKNAAMDKWQGGNVLFESKNDGVGLAPYHDTESAIPQAVKDQLTHIAAEMKAGKVTSGVKL